MYKFGATDGFYNFFFLLSQNSNINEKFVAYNALHQKFYKMFHTSSIQQRIFSN
jgi:hypothetical protein